MTLPTILGIVASQRRLGNSEVLVKEALLGAAETGAATKLMNLGRLRVSPCNGCLACVFKGEPCRIDDDTARFYDEVLAADGFIVGAPTYFLGPTGQLKMVLDRAIGYLPRIAAAGPRPAGVIVTAGLPRWDQLSIPLVSEFVLILGGRLMGSLTAYAPGPAQSLLDPENAAAAHRLGRAVALGQPLPTPAGACPVCHGRIFTPVGAGEVECPLCLIRGRVEADPAGGPPLVVFPPEAATQHRWTPEHMKKHFLEWIIPTRELFARDLKTIREARRKYEER